MTAEIKQERTLSKLFEGLAYTSPCDAVVTGLAYDSRKVEPGDAFFCVEGVANDGHDFAAAAIKAGAKVLVVERELTTAELGTEVPQCVVPNARIALAHSASRWYSEPSKGLRISGITGTNGKTTTTYLLDWILRFAKRTTGLVGTVETRIASRTEPSRFTTPEALELQQLLATMRDEGVTDVTMEVSSHAIALDRTYGIRFAAVAFSNLTQDHLDYHRTFEEYFEAKAKLFTAYATDLRVICVDDVWGRKLASRCEERELAFVTTSTMAEADFAATNIRLGADETRFTLVYSGHEHEVVLPLIGRFNVENALLAIACATAHGIDIGTSIKALEHTPQTPGRLERVADEGGFGVFVDYAHTPDSLEKAIGALRGVTSGRLIVVFGCGGDRDRTKRPLMGAAACSGDVAIVTSDNPRTEDARAIIDEIVVGMEPITDDIHIIVDRRDAIHRAVALAQPGDTVLIAGKGHEDYQIVGTQKQHFDDREIAAKEVARICC